MVRPGHDHRDTGNDTIDGQAAADTLTGSDGNDVVRGGDGADTIAGGTGADDLAGGTGNDVLHGDDGDDALAGDDGDDRLTGDDGIDSLAGGAGDDALDGARGADRLAGGAGTDTVSYEAAEAAVTVSLNAANDDGIAGEGDNVAGDVERIVGSSNDDALAGDDAPHTLIGGAGDDVLTGGRGPDTLSGGPGEDTLDGGQGADVLSGGEDLDTVTYASRLAGVTADLNGRASGEPGEGDRLDNSDENVVGGSGADTIVGAANVTNRVSGGPGNDTILLAGDPVAADSATCGLGADTVRLDRIDTFSDDCETAYVDGRVARPSGPPRVFVLRHTVRAGGDGVITLLLRCKAATRGVCSGTAALSFNSGGKRGTASGRVRVLPGADRRVPIRLTPYSKHLLARRKRMVAGRLHIRVRDVLGRQATRTVTLRVRPPLWGS
ncbi:MAG: hypothetical protein QOJ35_3418 [Solirubrobacteraceae bacterium]|nr:hypothetical protein [Solirubrobacteraceae bacterium]